jgi:hypothetical protein
MAYKQIMGKGPAMKTGAGIPKELMSGPAMHEGVVHEGTDPKGKTTVTRERATEGDQTGWRTTATTATPDSGGDSLSGNIIRTPEGDAAYAALDQAGRDAQDARFTALNPRVKGSTDVQSRFLADPIKPLTTPVVPVTRITEDAELIPTPTRFASTQFEIQADMGGGTQNPGKRRAISNVSTGGNRQPAGNTAQSASVMSTENRTVNLQQAAAVFKAAQAQNNAINEKFSEKNVRAQHAKKGGNLERMLKSAQERRDSNQARVNIFKAKN